MFLKCVLKAALVYLKKKKKKASTQFNDIWFQFSSVHLSSRAKYLMYLNPLAQTTKRTDYTDWSQYDSLKPSVNIIPVFLDGLSLHLTNNVHQQVMIHIKSKNGLYAHLLSGIRKEIIFHGSVKVVIISDRFITVHGEDVCCGWLSNVRPQANELNQNNISCAVSKKFENRENCKVTIVQRTKCRKKSNYFGKHLQEWLSTLLPQDWMKYPVIPNRHPSYLFVKEFQWCILHDLESYSRTLAR